MTAKMCPKVLWRTMNTTWRGELCSLCCPKVTHILRSSTRAAHICHEQSFPEHSSEMCCTCDYQHLHCHHRVSKNTAPRLVPSPQRIKATSKRQASFHIQGGLARSGSDEGATPPHPCTPSPRGLGTPGGEVSDPDKEQGVGPTTSGAPRSAYKVRTAGCPGRSFMGKTNFYVARLPPTPQMLTSHERAVRCAV